MRQQLDVFGIVEILGRYDIVHWTPLCSSLKATTKSTVIGQNTLRTSNFGDFAVILIFLQWISCVAHFRYTFRLSWKPFQNRLRTDGAVVITVRKQPTLICQGDRLAFKVLFDAFQGYFTLQVCTLRTDTVRRDFNDDSIRPVLEKDHSDFQMTGRNMEAGRNSFVTRSSRQWVYW